MVRRSNKVDIEGRIGYVCFPYLSFEVENDVDELIEHARRIAFSKFKNVGQTSFRELANQDCLCHRISRRFVRELGYADCRQLRRARRFFISGHKFRTRPWEDDSKWCSADHSLSRRRRAKATGTLSGWYDIHARFRSDVTLARHPRVQMRGSAPFHLNNGIDRSRRACFSFRPVRARIKEYL
jgi:hypothetical protein